MMSAAHMEDLFGLSRCDDYVPEAVTPDIVATDAAPYPLISWFAIRMTLRASAERSSHDWGISDT